MSTSWQWSIRYIWYPSDLVKCRTYHVDMHHIKKSLRFALTIVVDVKKRIIFSNYRFERRLTHIFLRDVRFNRRHEDIRQSDRTRRKEVRQDFETRQRNDVKVSCVKCRLTSLKSRVQKKRTLWLHGPVKEIRRRSSGRSSINTSWTFCG